MPENFCQVLIWILMKKSSFNDINRYRFNILNPDHKFLIRKYALSHIVKLASQIGYLLFPAIPKNLTILDRPIFIIGCSRSGTTLFADMLIKHPDIANWSEAGQVFELDYYNTETDHVKGKAAVTKREVCRLRLFFGVYTRIAGKPRFLNKHPQNSLRIPYLKTIFPDALFIHLIRDPRAVVYSHLAQVSRDRYRQAIPFGSFPKPKSWREYQVLSPAEQYTHLWTDIITAIRESAEEFLGDNDYIEVKYENFCKSPYPALAELDAFCGLDIDKRDYIGISEYFEIRNTKWQKRLSKSDTELIEKLAGPLMQELGYSV